MNVVIFGKGFRSPRQVNLTGVTAGLSIVVVVALIVSAGFVVGSWHASRTASRVSLDELQGLTGKLDEQRNSINNIRQENEGTLDALSIRIAQMNARMIRLDALGERLTQIARLEDGEFNFADTPGVGGPEGSPLQRSISSLNVQPELTAIFDKLDRKLDNREAQLQILTSMMSDNRLKKEQTVAGTPINKGWMSSSYGMRTDPFNGKERWHAGVDFAGKKGSEVIAVAAGVVTWSAKRSGYGDMVEINHGDGFVTRYGHNDENLVTLGSIVKKGQQIARMGSSGRSTGPHVHFEVYKNGRTVDPASYIHKTHR